MENCKVNILSTFYNDKKMCEIVLKSVLSQDYENIEHVVVDGGSTDGTVELLKEYEAKYEECGKKLTWISERDNGITDAANKAWKMLNGDYFIIFSDTFVNKRVIKDYVDIVKENGYDYIYGGVNYINEDKRIIRRWSGKGGNWRLGWIAATPTMFMKRSIINDDVLYDTSFNSAADYDLQLKLFKNKRLKSKSIPKPIINFQAGGTSNGGIKNIMISINECSNVLKKHNIKFWWVTNACKTFIALCAYMFASRKIINTEDSE